MEIYTIGFTKKSAREFFEALSRAGIKKLLDIRLQNTSHLAGFAKKNDLEYFLEKICNIKYEHQPLLAPDQKLFDDYKKKGISFDNFAARFKKLMEERRVDEELDRKDFEEPVVLLCSEPGPDKCHRRLAAEYLASKWPDVTVVHL